MKVGIFRRRKDSMPPESDFPDPPDIMTNKMFASLGERLGIEPGTFMDVWGFDSLSDGLNKLHYNLGVVLDAWETRLQAIENRA